MNCAKKKWGNTFFFVRLSEEIFQHFLKIFFAHFKLKKMPKKKKKKLNNVTTYVHSMVIYFKVIPWNVEGYRKKILNIAQWTSIETIFPNIIIFLANWENNTIVSDSTTGSFPFNTLKRKNFYSRPRLAFLLCSLVLVLKNKISIMWGTEQSG